MCTCVFKHVFLHEPVLNSNSNTTQDTTLLMNQDSGERLHHEAQGESLVSARARAEPAHGGHAQGAAGQRQGRISSGVALAAKLNLNVHAPIISLANFEELKFKYF